MKRLFIICLFCVCALAMHAQSLVISQSLELVAMSSAVSQYNNQFGRFNNPDLDEPFPYAVICMNLSGDVRAAKEVINLDLGTMLMVQSTHRDIDNTILFLVPVSAKNIYLTCGDGCSRQLLWNQGKMQSNKVYKCAVEYRKAQEAKQDATSSASDEKMDALLAQMVAMQQEIARLQQQPQPQDNPNTMAMDGKLSFEVNGVKFTMIKVEGGTFTMGGTSEQGSDVNKDEKPPHSVTLSSYYMGETEVTQALWGAVMGQSLTHVLNETGWRACGLGGDYPMYDINYDDCITFVSKLNNLLASQLKGKRFALPTEAQWEYAARGGNKSKGCKYSGSDSLSTVAWYDDKNYGNTTHPVKTKQANELELYDMSGNVYEWCQDWYGSYSITPQTNPVGSSSGIGRVVRGGSWYNGVKRCRVSHRNYFSPSYYHNNLGLRLCLIP